MTSLPSNADFLHAAGALIAASEAMGLSEARRITVTDLLAERGLSFRADQPPATVARLEFGAEAQGEVPATAGDELRLGSLQHELVVPDNAERLDVEVSANTDVDLYLRHNTTVQIADGSIRSTARSESDSASERIELSGGTDPAPAAGSWFVGVVNRSSAVAEYTLEAELEVRQTDRVVPIAAGDEVSGRVGPGAFAPEQYRLPVADASDEMLTLSVAGDVDPDLYLRSGAPVEIGREGRVVADTSARTPSSSETVVLDELTVPRLGAGEYYLAVRNAGTSEGSFTLRAELEDVPPVTRETEGLAPGSQASGTVDASSTGTSRLHPRQYLVDVPDDGARLVLAASSPNDVSLFARHGERVDFSDPAGAYDGVSAVPESGDERLVIDLLSEPPLEPGEYFVAVANRSGEKADFTIEAELTTGEFGGRTQDLPSERWQSITVDPGGTGELAPTQYRMTVEAGASGLDVVSNPQGPGDIDLYVRKGRPVQVLDGELVAHWRGETERGAESITVFEEELAPGTYYLGIVNRGTEAVQTDLFASYGPALPLSVPVTDGQLFEGRIGAAAPGGCTITLEQFVVRVPANALRLEVNVVPVTEGPLDVLSRFGSRVLIDRGAAVFDQVTSTDDGPLVFEGTDIRPGLQFFSVSNCQTTEERYRFSVRMAVSGGGETVLRNGEVAYGFAEPSPPAEERLASTQYRFTVPDDTAELTAGAWVDDCANADLDLLIAFEERVELEESGGSNASWRADRRGPAAETVVISESSRPRIRPGTYWIAVINRSPSAVRFA